MAILRKKKKQICLEHLEELKDTVKNQQDYKEEQKLEQRKPQEESQEGHKLYATKFEKSIIFMIHAEASMIFQTLRRKHVQCAKNEPKRF